MGSQTEENYLKALYKLSDDKGNVGVSDLSSMLKVSVPTANSMVKKMHSRGWLKYEKYKPITITPKGKKMASMIIRKHRLTEMYLVEQMGFSWENVHEIAEQVEHVKSEAFFDRMDELLGFPKFDPHGSPIPDKNGKIVEQNLIKLSDCSEGQHYTLSALLDSKKDLLEYLNNRSLFLGTKLEIVAKESFDGNMTVRYDSHENEVLSQKVCESLLVNRV
ncbi:metal-dependent transcriptional regulator [Fulvivirga maritima]|uniref:metal-dependent transcriptional regulator n=1 Tax=Fulvivirga maritima TaxID=2904247 RepID=UPI001F2AE7B6|nr:metal-dependent transcriptional regulator [Fulvivirga maritima]UII25829.1 metal-dependent transcriptional regulator [Fulvivirga maritima]